MDHIAATIQSITSTDCAYTMNTVLAELGKDLDIRIMTDEFIGHYSEYVVEEIRKVLDKDGFCGVAIDNGTGYNDWTFSHCLVLLKENGKLYRVESYADLYTPRITEDERFLEKFELLLALPVGERRCLWNNLFGGKEKEDTTEEKLDVTLYVR